MLIRNKLAAACKACVPLRVCQKQNNAHCGSYLMPEEAAKALKHARIYQARHAFNNLAPVYDSPEERFC